MPRSFARGLPHPDSPGERLLFKLHRKDGRLPGAVFNEKVGPYWVDIFFPAARLVVEIDGAQWHAGARAEADRRRDAELKRAGYRVMRIPHTEVMRNTYACLFRIEARLPQELTPQQAALVETLRAEAREWHEGCKALVHSRLGGVFARSWERDTIAALDEEFGPPSDHGVTLMRERIDLAVRLWATYAHSHGIRVPQALVRPGS